MVLYHKSTRTKYSGTGGLKRSSRDKVKAHWGGFFARAKAEKTAKEEARVTKESKGGKTKIAAKTILFANVAVGGKVQKAKIDTVVKSPDNRTYARENILTRGAIVQTDLGQARITSRPGQDGIVNAVLIAESKAVDAKPSKAAKPTKA